ncbi:MAG: alpha/beta hydrolase [Spongiibacteraceae bacterium]
MRNRRAGSRLFALGFVIAFVTAPASSLASALLDISYGHSPQQRFDVYPALTSHNSNRPIIVMVHGGAWQFGDKRHRGSIKNKGEHWRRQGWLFISVNYRMMPEAKPLTQAKDLALALLKIQANASKWGGDPQKIVLVGHSAGAHLVALLSSSHDLQSQLRPWLGSVVLDTAALDLVALMQAKHHRLYDKAFGSVHADWISASPIAQLHKNTPPLLLVCSEPRENSCNQARIFSAQARKLDVRNEILPINLSHRKINTQLGLSNSYTAQVDAFILSLDPQLSSLLTK